MKMSSAVCASATRSSAAAFAAAALASVSAAFRARASSTSRCRFAAASARAAAASVNAFLMISSTHLRDAAALEHSATTWSSNQGTKSVSISRCTGS